MNKVEFAADTGAPRIHCPVEPDMGSVGRNLRGRVGHGLGGWVQLLDGCHSV